MLNLGDYWEQQRQLFDIGTQPAFQTPPLNPLQQQQGNPVPNSTAATSANPVERLSAFQKAFGTKQNVGYVPAGIQGLSALMNAYNGYQSNKLARQQFDFQKGFAEQDYANRASEYNRRLADSYASRQWSKGNDVGDGRNTDYVRRNSVKTTL